MSRGFAARLVKELEDKEYVLFKYASANASNENYAEMIEKLDGIILVNKKCFVEPEIHMKRKRMPSGKIKVFEKRIPVEVEYGRYIDEGLIKIENASGCWRTINEIDFMALKLLYKLFNEYQVKGNIPEKISWFS